MSGLSLLNNISSNQVQRALELSSKRFEESLARLSSGMRINRASDDAAGLAVSSQLLASSRVYGQAINNLNDGISLLNVAEGALGQLNGIGERLKELASQAANGVYSSTQRSALDAEAGSLISEFNRTLQSTQFNGRTLLGGNFGGLHIQAGYGSGEGLDFNLGAGLERAAGTGSFTAKNSNSVFTTLQGGVNGDFNGDGNTDFLAIQNGTGSYALGLSSGLGNGNFGGPTYSVFTSNSLSIAATGDFNGDGRLDVVLGGVAEVGLRIALNNGNGTFSIGATIGTAPGAVALSTLDLNGDGITDVATVDSSGYVVGYIGAGNGTFSASASAAIASGATAMASGDFNGDGFTDIAITRAADVSILLANGNGTFKVGSRITVSASPTSLAVADFNGDGISDIVTAGTAINMLMGNGNGSFAAPVTYATSGSNVSAADFNDDGILDVAVNSSLLFGNRDGTLQSAISTGVSGTQLLATTFSSGGQVGFITTSGATFRGYTALTNNTTTMKNINLKTRADALAAFTTIEATLARIAAETGNIGAQQSRYSSALRTLQATTENYRAAASRITDTDVAFESANLIRNRILQETSAALLAQANLAPRLALDLLRSG